LKEQRCEKKSHSCSYLARVVELNGGDSLASKHFSWCFNKRFALPLKIAIALRKSTLEEQLLARHSLISASSLSFPNNLFGRLREAPSDPKPTEFFDLWSR